MLKALKQTLFSTLLVMVTILAATWFELDVNRVLLTMILVYLLSQR